MINVTLAIWKECPNVILEVFLMICLFGTWGIAMYYIGMNGFN